jgi:molybdenum cofactor cytidylyltransferase
VAAVVLAAGSSTRMGRNKLLLDLGGETIVRRAVRAAVGAGVDQIVVVLGHEEPRLRAELEGLPCSPVVNPDHAEGAGTSVRTGVRHVAAGTDAIVVVLADMPFVTAEMIATLVRRYRETGAPLVASHYGEVQAPPTLYDRALFEELLQIPGERCAKQVVRRHESEAVVVAWPESALRDIDVPADYEGARAELAGG